MAVEKVRVRNWRDVKAEARRRGLTNPARVADVAREQMETVRAYRLAEVRKAQGITQTDVADAMHVSQGRVSKIERGDLAHSELGTLQAYVTALGGRLRVTADFGDQSLILE